MIKNSLHVDMEGTYKGKKFTIVDVGGNEITIKYKDSGKSEIVNKEDLEEGTTGWKTNSFKMPFDLAPARAARGQSLYGTSKINELKNAGRYDAELEAIAQKLYGKKMSQLTEAEQDKVMEKLDEGWPEASKKMFGKNAVKINIK